MSCVRGKVVSGRADFGLWIERLSSFYEQKTGMRLYPGTLNVELPLRIHFPGMSFASMRMNMEEGSRSASFHPGSLTIRRFYYARIRTNKARDITRGMSLKSLPTFGCVTLTN